MLKNNSIYITGLLIWMIPGILCAQEEVPEKYNERVVVTAPYQPSIESVDRLDYKPTYSDSLSFSKTLRYDIMSRPVSTRFPIENISAARVMGEPISKLLNNRLKLGFGYPVSPLAILNLGWGRDQKYALGVDFEHHSSFGKIKNYDTSFNQTSNRLDLFGEVYTEHVNIILKPYYNWRKVNCYGFNKDRILPVNDFLIKNPVRTIENAGLDFILEDNAQDEEAFHYKADIAYNFNFTNWQSMENVFELAAGMHKGLSFQNDKFDLFALGGDVFLGTYAIKPSRVAINSLDVHIRFEPKVKMKFSMFEIFAALRFNVYEEDRFKLQFNPVIDLKIHAVEDLLMLYTGINGNVNRFTLSDISERVPYLNPIVGTELGYTKDKFTYYIGLQSNFSKNISFNLRASASWIDQMLSYDMFRYEQGIMFVAYNDFTITKTDLAWYRVGGELSYRPSNTMKLDLSLGYNYYDAQILYKPAFEARLNYRYTIQEKFVVKTELYAYTGMKALNELAQPYMIKGYVDWNAGLEYIVNKRWSCFLDLNNIIGKRNFFLYDYPTYGFNFMLGASFAF